MYKSVLISDNQAIVRKGIISILKNDFTELIIDENDEPKLLLKKLEENKHSLVIVDYLQYQDSDKLLKSLQKLSPQLKVLIVSQDDDIEKIKEVIQLGVEGFLTRHCETEEMVNAVRRILQGKRFFCQTITDKLLEYEIEKEVIDTKLSKRELEILTLVAKGKTTNEIAQKLFISVHTVNSHRKNMLKKLGLKSPIELVTYAMDKGLVS